MNHEKHESDEKILFKEEGFAIQGAIFDVYREWARGFWKLSIRNVWL